MKIIDYDLKNPKVQYLLATDEKLAKLINYISYVNLELEEDGFKCIVKYIVGQQISDKARETIWNRLNSKYNVEPKEILNIDNIELLNVGLSRRKVSYIKNLASAVFNNQLNFNTLKCLSNEDIIKQLTSIKGIGNWTAEMYIIFSLGREDVLSVGDGTIRRTLQWMYSLDKLPSQKEVYKFFENWLPYSTIVSVFFWKSIELEIYKDMF